MDGGCIYIYMRVCMYVHKISAGCNIYMTDRIQKSDILLYVVSGGTEVRDAVGVYSYHAGTTHTREKE